MANLAIQFDQPVTNMAFSCAGRNIASYKTIQKQPGTGSDAANKLPIQDELALSIERKLGAIDSKLDSILPQLKSLAVDYIEGFVGALFEADRELVRDKVLSNLNSALESLETGRVSEIFVHPELVEIIKASLAKREIADISVVADPLLNQADCRIEGPEETLIARLERHMQIAKQHALESSNA